MNFSKKKLFRKINTEIRFSNPEYVRYALSTIKLEVESAAIDDSFCNEYYKLKKKIDIIDGNYMSVFLSVLISGSFLLASGLTIVGLVLFSAALLSFLYWFIDNNVTKQGCVLEPYLLKCMEDKISKSTIELPTVSKTASKKKLFRAIEKFVANNRVLAALTFLATIITVSYTLTSHLPEVVPGIGKWYKLLSDLSIGVIINFIFYVFQVYIPHLQAEEASFPAIKPELVKMLNEIQEAILVIEHFFPQYKQGRFNITENTVYYILQEDLVNRRGWARKFDLFSDFTPIIKTVNESLDKLLASVFLPNCDKELTQLLGQLKLNRFLKALSDAQKDKYDSDATYGDFANQYPEFKAIYESLKRYTDGAKTRYLFPLTESEIDYIKGFHIEAYEGRGTVRFNVDFTKEG